ncbi:preprotein translocase subunit YajC [Tundrisphaera lichenicola]|uniref:preprotein translocase subunit YajC n=1 Tax=Tundrisphaera lichenicola TaxID=2029860 RepID=UPI003EBAF0CC
MLGLFSGLPILLAQAAAPVAGNPEVNPLIQYAPLLPIPIIFYFLLLRPQQQQEKKRREMISKLRKNDKVLTAAGMYGTVLSVDDDSDKVVLRLDDDGKVKIAFTRASIVRVLGDTASKPVEAK